MALVVPINQRPYGTILHLQASRKGPEAFSVVSRVHFAAVEKVDHRAVIQKYDLTG